VVGLSKALFDE